MNRLQTNSETTAGPPPGERLASVVDLDRRRAMHRERRTSALQCVSSGYLSDGCSCGASVPADDVIAAWARALARGGARDAFFSFATRAGAWVGYGLADGSVRGVYCPAHSAEREVRATAV